MLQDLHLFLDKNFFYLFWFAVIWCIVGFGLTWLWMKKKGMTFPEKSTVNIKFEENMASGRSHKSIITKLGGAKNCLKVIVTDEELWITAQFPFNIVAYYYDSIHKIPLALIQNISKLNKNILIEFQRNDGSPGKFELQLKKLDNFMKIIQKN